MANLSDKELVSRYLHGDEIAMNVFYDRYEKMLYFFILKKVRRSDLAEDLFQEIWIKVLQNLPKVHFSSSMKSWLFRISMNHIIDYFRQQKTRAPVYSLDRSVSHDDAEKKNSFYSLLADPGTENPRESAIEKEKEKIFRQALAELSPEIQEVVLLRVEHEFKFKDIARITDTPLNTVLSRMRQATLKMSEYVREKGGTSL